MGFIPSVEGIQKKVVVPWEGDSPNRLSDLEMQLFSVSSAHWPTLKDLWAFTNSLKAIYLSLSVHTYKYPTAISLEKPNIFSVTLLSFNTKPWKFTLRCPLLPLQMLTWMLVWPLQNGCDPSSKSELQEFLSNSHYFSRQVYKLQGSGNLAHSTSPKYSESMWFPGKRQLDHGIRAHPLNH